MKRIWRAFQFLAWGFFLWAQRKLDARRVPPVTGGSPRRELKVFCDAPIGWNRKKFLRAAAGLRGLLGTDVCIHAQLQRAGRNEAGDESVEGRAVPPVDDGSFHVHIWSTPRDGGHQTPPPWQERNLLGPCFRTSELGLEIKIDGWPAAELVGSNLYIHCPLGFGFVNEEAEVFAAIIRKAEELLRLPAEEQRELLERTRRDARVRARVAFLRLTPARQAMRQAERARNDASNAESISSTVSGKFLEARREWNRVASAHRVELALYEAERRRLAAEFDELMIEQVQRVAVTQNYLDVTTRPLICTHPVTGARHEIGAFNIRVYFDGSKGGVRWTNLTNPLEIDGQLMQAPLVRGDGSVWSAAMGEVFMDFIIERSFPVVVSLAIQFIESPDQEAFGVRYITYWPVARENQHVPSEG